MTMMKQTTFFRIHLLMFSDISRISGRNHH